MDQADNLNSQSAVRLDSDWILIERIRQCDEPAFETIFNKYKTLVLNLAYRFVRDRMTAEDIVQEVFIKVHSGKAKVNVTAKFSTWLYRVTVNASLDKIRRRKLFPWSWSQRPGSLGEEIFSQDGGEVAGGDSAGEAVSRAERGEVVRCHVYGLREKWRIPVLLFHWKDLSYNEIAAILGVTPKAVERRLCRARKILRKKMGGGATVSSVEWLERCESKKGDL